MIYSSADNVRGRARTNQQTKRRARSVRLAPRALMHWAELDAGCGGGRSSVRGRRRWLLAIALSAKMCRVWIMFSILRVDRPMALIRRTTQMSYAFESSSFGEEGGSRTTTHPISDATIILFFIPSMSIVSSTGCKRSSLNAPSTETPVPHQF